MASKMSSPTQHIAANHLAIADAVTAVAGGGAIWGYFTGYLTPLVSFLFVCVGIMWYVVQILGSPWYQAWRAKRRARHLARQRRKLRRKRQRKAFFKSDRYTH
jgi:hypothetical protein